MSEEEILKALFKYAIDNELDIAANAFAQAHHDSIFGVNSQVHPCVTKAIFIKGVWWERSRKQKKSSAQNVTSR